MNRANEETANAGDVNDFEALDDERLLGLVRLAKNEAPRETLEARLLESVTYRTRLLNEAATPRKRHSGLALGAAALALAASVVLWFKSGEAEKTAGDPENSVALGKEPMHELTAEATAKATPPVPKVPPPDPCTVALSAKGSLPFIDDFEDGDDAIMNNEGRSGFWRWVRDTDAAGTAPALLPVPRLERTAKNRLALHVKGGRLREWGATMEFVFDQKCYDASLYSGIAFEGRGSVRVYVAPREVSVIPVSEGGMCEQDCHNNHVTQVQLEDEWKTYEVRFDQVEQRGYNRPPLNPKRMHSLAFLIRPEDTPYDVWIDSVRFLPR